MEDFQPGRHHAQRRRYRCPVAPVEHSAEPASGVLLRTGWRASETFMYARAMGWPHVAVYDGGWYEWSSNPHIRWPAESAARKAVVTRPASARRPCRRRAIPRLRCGRYPL